MPCRVPNPANNKPEYDIQFFENHNYSQVSGYCLTGYNLDKAVEYGNNTHSSMILKKGYLVILYERGTKSVVSDISFSRIVYAASKDLWIPYLYQYKYNDGKTNLNNTVSRTFKMWVGANASKESVMSKLYNKLGISETQATLLEKQYPNQGFPAYLALARTEYSNAFDKGIGVGEVIHLYTDKNMKIKLISDNTRAFKTGKYKISNYMNVESIHLAYGHGVKLYPSLNYTGTPKTYYNSGVEQGELINLNMRVGSIEVMTKPDKLQCQIASVVPSITEDALCSLVYSIDKNEANAAVKSWCSRDTRSIKNPNKGGNANCYAWCKAHPSDCDSIKTAYCSKSSNKTNSWCKCLNAREQPDLYKISSSGASVNNEQGLTDDQYEVLMRGVNPICHYKHCDNPRRNDLESGFFDDQIKHTKDEQCDVIITNQIADVDIIDSTIGGDVNVEQEATVNTGTSSEEPPQKPKEPPQKPEEPPQDSEEPESNLSKLKAFVSKEKFEGIPNGVLLIVCLIALLLGGASLYHVFDNKSASQYVNQSHKQNISV